MRVFIHFVIGIHLVALLAEFSLIMGGKHPYTYERTVQDATLSLVVSALIVAWGWRALKR